MRRTLHFVAAVVAGLALLTLGVILVNGIWPELFTGSPPPIVADLQFKSENDTAIAKIFDARIHQRFPVGSPEQSLRQTMAEQGFKSSPEIAPGLVYYWGPFPCSKILIVSWTADKAHRLVTASGDYQVRCI